MATKRKYIQKEVHGKGLSVSLDTSEPVSIPKLIKELQGIDEQIKILGYENSAIGLWHDEGGTDFEYYGIKPESDEEYEKRVARYDAQKKKASAKAKEKRKIEKAEEERLTKEREELERKQYELLKKKFEKK